MNRKIIVLVVSVLALFIGCRSNGEKEEVYKGPDIEWTEEKVEENIGKNVYCSLESFEEFNKIASEKYGNLYFSGEIISIDDEKWNGGTKPFVVLADGENTEKIIKVYWDRAHSMHIGDVVYANGMIDVDKKDNGYICRTAEFSDSNEKNEYATISETVDLLDALYGTKIKTVCFLDGQESFYCELETGPENKENPIGIICYTEEDLREYDQQWIMIEGNYFMDSYSGWGLLNAHKIDEDIK